MKERLQRLMDDDAGGISQFYRTNEERLDYALRHIAVPQSQFRYPRHGQPRTDAGDGNHRRTWTWPKPWCTTSRPARKPVGPAGRRTDYPERDDARTSTASSKAAGPGDGRSVHVYPPVEQIIPGDRHTA